jgi:hypothetical protein
VTDSIVLVLTDDELTCIAATNSKAWPLPLGPVRDTEVVLASALAGERSLIARGLLGRHDSGTFALGTEAFPYLRPCLESEPGVVVFLADDEFRWALQGMSVAWYREGGTDVLEVRAANGLHHFTLPSADGVIRGLKNYLTAVHESGFPDAIPGVSLALCAVSQPAKKAFRVKEDKVWEADLTDVSIAALVWQDSTLERALEAITQL